MKKTLKITILIVVFALLFCILFVLSSMGGLRFFIPHYFSVAGAPFQEKNYLVLFQNNNELRPAGGFISAYGILKFKNGLFAGIEVNDVFGNIAKHEYIEAPYPQKELLQGKFYQGYTFRDANYYADFPKSVAELMKMYRLSDTKTNFDGVIAINIKVLEDAVKILKEVRVDDYKFTKDNVFELIEYAINNIDTHDIEQLKTRKSILGPFTNAIIKKIVFSPLLWRDISDMVVKNLNEKHILLHFFNSGLQKTIDEKGWSGAWPEIKGDFLAVVEANLAGLKSDRYIKRNIEYRLQLWENSETNGYVLTGKVRITMEHFGNYNIPISAVYNGYLRLYLPKGAILRESNVTNKEEPSESNTIFGTIVKLNPGEKKTIEFTFETPASVFDGKKYNLDLVKQPGTINDNYSVVIEAPQGVTLKSDTFETRENYAIFDGELIKDKSLSFEVIPDMLGPRVAFAYVKDLNTVMVVFNERVKGESMYDTLNYSLEDLDVTNPGQHDDIRIKSVSIDYQDLKLDISGMSNQPEEFYKLTIQKGYDIHGNSIKPVPKISTIVQR